MAKKLNKDGVPVEIPSVQRKSKSIFGETGLDRKESHAGRGGRRGAVLPEEPPTRPASWVRNPTIRGASSESGEPRTVIAGGWVRPTTASPKAYTPPGEGMEDPVVGWLVIVDGPGMGHAVRLGNGQNTVGRGKASRARIEFGDNQISRSTHAVVTYDPKGNKFYVQGGTGTNLTYLNDAPVLSPTPLDSGSWIVLGQTTLRFVALCDDAFSWTDLDRAGASE